jgi:hypothetical protein
MVKKRNRYERIIEDIFFEHYQNETIEFNFSRDEIVTTANKLGIELPKNIGDIIYAFRYRSDLPNSIKEKAPSNNEWVIKPAGTATYKFVAVPIANIVPTEMLVKTKIPDATPGIIEKYALTDEQALLAKLRYNRLIDIFTGLTCYSLQNHLRTSIPNLGQVETDEIYIGIDQNGVHYVITIQAKGGTDKIGIVQIEQDIEICKHKFPHLICKPLAAQFIEHNLICLFEFIENNGEISIAREKQYLLVPPDELTVEEIESYKNISSS